MEKHIKIFFEMINGVQFLSVNTSKEVSEKDIKQAIVSLQQLITMNSVK